MPPKHSVRSVDDVPVGSRKWPSGRERTLDQHGSECTTGRYRTVRINTNLDALNAQNQLRSTGLSLSKSVERLSSGLRINRAADDAAGLTISEKLRGQIRGLNQAVRNAQDGISMIQTAEGGLNETHSILQRMRELAVQASNDTLALDDRQAISAELTALNTEINRISGDTQFNTKTL